MVEIALRELKANGPKQVNLICETARAMCLWWGQDL
jgi:hypothetical protein